MWRGTRSFYCALPKEPYLDQRRGALWRLVPFLFTSVHPSTRQSYCRKLDFRFTAFSEVKIIARAGPPGGFVAFGGDGHTSEAAETLR